MGKEAAKNTKEEKAKKSKVTPLIAQYLEVKSQYKDCLLFYRMGDFYEMLFDDAVTAAAELNITLTHRGQMDGKDIPLCGVPFHAYEPYLARLVKKGYKVAICEQMETPEEAQKRDGRTATIRREVIRVVTAGTLTEDALLPAKKDNYLVSVVFDNVQTGLAWADLSTGDFFTQSVPGNMVYSLLMRSDVAEIIVSKKMEDHPKFRQIISEVPEKITYMSDLLYVYSLNKDVLEKKYKVNSLDALGDFTRQEVVAAGLVIAYLSLTQKTEVDCLKKLRRITDEQTMEIDAATRNNLEIFAPLNDIKGAYSLFGVLDRTVSNAGGRFLARTLASPSTNVDEINQRLDAISFLTDHPKIKEEISEHLNGMPDMERCLSRITLGRCGPRDLALLLVGLTASIASHISFNFFHDELPPLLKDLHDNLNNFNEFRVTINQALKLPDDITKIPTSVRDGDFIEWGYDAGLDDLRKQRAELQNSLREMQLDYANLTGIKNLKVSFNAVAGYFVEVPIRHSSVFNKHPEWGFELKQTTTTVIRYSCPKLREVEQQLYSLDNRIQFNEERIFNEMVDSVKRGADKIRQSAHALAMLDMLIGFSNLAVENNYCRPTVDYSSAFDIKGGRHPVVEFALKKEHSNFVENDCELKEQNGYLWLLTGPNMAGKSTFLRQNALIAIMAQIGSYVPATSAHIGVIDKLFSRVGAADNLARGQSTFMVEMSETATILNRATEKSLVILDEIGRGTATFDGLSIAWAVMEYLHDHNKCRGLFATHYHELTLLKEKLAHLSLHCMETKDWNGDVVFLHTVKEGSVDKSYGIHVAKLAGLPDLVIQRAKEILSGLEEKKKKVEKLVGDLPLFSAVLEKQAQDEQKHEQSPIEKELTFLNLDSMSPKEALDTLYRLKGMLE